MTIISFWFSKHGKYAPVPKMEDESVAKQWVIRLRILAILCIFLSVRKFMLVSLQLLLMQIYFIIENDKIFVPNMKVDA